MITAHLKKLRRRIEVSADEERSIQGLVAETRRFGPDQVLIRAGEPLSNSLLLLDGWLSRNKDLASGERQVLHLHVSGDFADLHGYTLKRLDHDVMTLSECEIAVVPHERIQQLIERHPRLGRYYWFSTNLDAAITREFVLSLGQRSAMARMAHLFCELHIRLDIVDEALPDGFAFPLTQRELSECLGLTVVHVNRTLQELRRRGLVELESRRLTIVNRPGLEAIAEFDPGYLYLERMPF